MTDKEKLEKLFAAALQDGSSFNQPPTRAFPESKIATATINRAAAPVANDAPDATPTPVTDRPAAAVPVVAEFAEPKPNVGLDEETSAELGSLLDAQLERVSRRRRRELVVTLLVFFGLIGGGFGWFVHSPARVTAFKSAIAEIRSVGDIKGMMGKYQKALDKIGSRGKEMDDASIAMGVDPTTVQDEDPYLEAETEAFTGEKGTGVGARNKKFKERFGNVVKAPLTGGDVGSPKPSIVNR